MFCEQNTRRQLRCFTRSPSLALVVKACLQAQCRGLSFTATAFAGDAVLPQVVTQDTIQTFRKEGHVTCPRLINRKTVALLNERLENVLRGEFDLGVAPDKMPKGRNLWSCGKRTLQIVNIRKADSVFQSVILSPVLGKYIAELGGWNGARVASDQVWAKPPLGGPLVFHRDSAYFDFIPSDVITLWLALDDMTPDLGPLEYVHGSHKWGEGRVGSANQFFDKDRTSLMHSAAKREGYKVNDLRISMVRCGAGGAGVHDGRTWHGSGPNMSKSRPRRGLGIHFVPSDVVFRKGELGKMWRKFRHQSTNQVDEVEFPITYRSKS